MASWNLCSISEREPILGDPANSYITASNIPFRASSSAKIDLNTYSEYFSGASIEVLVASRWDVPG